jgi:hypothetical protein
MFGINVSAKGRRTHTNITVDTNAAALLVDNPNRKSLILQNQGSVTVFLGKLGVSQTGATRGYAMAAGTSFTDDASFEAWYAIAASGSAIVHIIEVS